MGKLGGRLGCLYKEACLTWACGADLAGREGHRGELGIVVGVGKAEGVERGFLGIGKVVGKVVGVGAGGGGRWGGGGHVGHGGLRGEQRNVSGTKRRWIKELNN